MEELLAHDLEQTGVDSASDDDSDDDSDNTIQPASPERNVKTGLEQGGAHSSQGASDGAGSDNAHQPESPKRNKVDTGVFRYFLLLEYFTHLPSAVLVIPFFSLAFSDPFPSSTVK